MPDSLSPVLTSREFELLARARACGASTLTASMDLQRSVAAIGIGPSEWTWKGSPFPYAQRWKERTIYHWTQGQFQPASRYSAALVKLVPTDWGPPTFEIDGIKMLPSARESPLADAERKVALVRPRDKVILDTCAGLGYFAACAAQAGALAVHSFERNPDVLWLRGLNPWSPVECPALRLELGDVTAAVTRLDGSAFDAILHDPPRFGIAGDLYSREFYAELARVLKRGGTMFHYTGAPNQRSRGRDLAQEVMIRLRHAGFEAERALDGVLAARR